jgi:hypothetical protein
MLDDLDRGLIHALGCRHGRSVCGHGAPAFVAATTGPTNLVSGTEGTGGSRTPVTLSVTGAGCPRGM